MKSNDFLVEGIVEDAHEMHQDHEVQMAREECYHAAGDAIALHKLLKHVSEQQGIEGWVAAKVTLAADYLNTVREYLEYELMSGHQEPVAGAEQMLPVAEGVITADDFKAITEVSPHDFDSDVDYYNARDAKPKIRTSMPRHKGGDVDAYGNDWDEEEAFRANQRHYAAAKKKTELAADHARLATGTNEGVAEDRDHSPVANAITRRIIRQHPDVLAKYGPDVVMQAIDEIADFAGDVEEIGSSDISGWVSQVIRSLGRFAPARNNGIAEGLNEKSVSQAQFRTMAAVAHNPKFAKKVGISQKVGREFHQADKSANYKKLPKKVNELDMYNKAPTKDSDDWSSGTVKYADPAAATNRPTSADWAKNSADFDKKYPTPQAYNQRQIELYNKKYPGVPAPTDLTGDSEENRQAQLKALQTPGVKEARIDFAKKLQKNIGKTNTARAKTHQGVENWTKDLSKEKLDKLAGPRYKKDAAVKEDGAGSIATVVNPTPKNKAKTGTLFGGTYKQPKARK